MALIKCPECGNEVSDRAASCPRCGCPISSTSSSSPQSNVKKIPVRFFRKRSINTSYGVSGSVIVDGVTVGASNVGCDFEVMLTPGNHNVVFTSRNSMTHAEQTTSETIKVPANARKVNVQIDSKIGAMSILGNGAVKIVIKDITVE